MARGRTSPARVPFQTFFIARVKLLGMMTYGLRAAAAGALVALLATGCNGGGSSAPHFGTGTAFVGILSTLHTQTTIGSTVDPGPGAGAGDQNPYGLAFAPVSAGKLTAGDLVVCNFNDAANVQGNGTTIVVLHPTPGAAPTRVAQSPSLKGCDALTLDGNDAIYTADFVADDAPIFAPNGTPASANANAAWSGPFGAIFSSTAGPFGSASVFESNATSGTVTRMNVQGGAVTSVTTIATGFTPNTGVPGGIAGPSGLTYDPNSDQLYVVDGGANRLVAFSHASSIPANGIVVGTTGFTGPSAANARIVSTSSAINAPVSAALLANGDVVVGNTGDNNLLEFTPSGFFVGSRNVDSGNAGAIFGIVATGTTPANQKIYFNDDNTNTVVLLSQ